MCALCSCITRLMQDVDNPRVEDIECLCKLLSTIGQQLERPETKANARLSHEEQLAAAKARMDVYFSRCGIAASRTRSSSPSRAGRVHAAAS